jgi:hypothetical protein
MEENVYNLWEYSELLWFWTLSIVWNFNTRKHGVSKTGSISVSFEIFTTLTMKNGVFWDATPGGSCKNRRFGET